MFNKNLSLEKNRFSFQRRDNVAEKWRLEIAVLKTLQSTDFNVSN